MTIVTPLRHRHRRRIIAVCAATVALHFVTINWVSGRIGATEQEREAGKGIINAELRLAPPPPPAPAPAADARPAKAPKPKPRKPKPVPPPEDAAPAVAPADPEPAPVAVAEPDAPAIQSDAAPAPPDVESAQPEPTAQQEGPASTRRWKVELPPSAKLEMDVKRKDADGTNWSGSATISWQHDGMTYKAAQEVGVSLLIARVNLLEVSSEGTIDDYGIAPAKFTEKRRNRSATNTHFNQQEQKITFSASERTVPLQSGAQDRATVLFQLAGIGRADVNQYGQEMNILVGEDRKAEVYRFQLVGEEELETKMGKLVTWHIVRPPRPGSYNAKLDIWLAPSLEWYPVQIRNSEANGAITTQTVTRITK
ncbi:DUF3108 domain-containing protein [Pseudoduganella sp. OTU4001]|uniref:DUF3108 domain-containing protein n=1 Tax=Pseudoduganella sp. OTU4001 TaxID=3043854 RepID=UPI00313AC60A